MKNNTNIVFKRMTETSIKNFNMVEAQGWVINRTVIIEGLINSIILDYFSPTDRELFLSHVLNSTVMHYGGKLKVLNGIGLEKSTFQSLQRIGNIRNSFAHTNITYKMTISENEEGFLTSVSPQINVMNGAGEIKPKDPYELVVEFLELYKEIEPELKHMHNKIKVQ